jgi:sRNA-binding carbon storage regulator CsrA
MRSKLGMNAPRELQVKRDRVARQEEADAEYNLPTKPPLPGR